LIKAGSASGDETCFGAEVLDPVGVGVHPVRRASPRNEEQMRVFSGSIRRSEAVRAHPVKSPPAERPSYFDERQYKYLSINDISVCNDAEVSEERGPALHRFRVKTCPASKNSPACRGRRLVPICLKPTPPHLGVSKHIPQPVDILFITFNRTNRFFEILVFQGVRAGKS